MNRVEEIKEVRENFEKESKQSKMQISEIEEQRTKLAKKRNAIKQENSKNNFVEISRLGKKISELGNESQRLQNKLDIKFNEIKRIVNLTIDNLVTEEIRKVRKIEEEQKEIEEKILEIKEKNARYEFQKSEFYKRFGRMPEVSENSRKEDESQAKQISLYKKRSNEIEKSIVNTENELVELASIKRNFRNENWSSIIEKQEVVKEVNEESIILPLMEEEFQVEETEPIEYIDVKKFEPIEKVEIGEIEIETPNKIEEIEDEKQVDEIERLARAIVEEIVAEQTKELKINNIEEKEIIEKEEISTEKEPETSSKDIVLLNIIAKVEDGEIVYKAQINNGEEIKVYPTLEVKNVLLNDREYREEIKEFLISYATTQHKMFDSRVTKKIDPTVCQILEKFAKKYNLDEKCLVYDYAMSFSKNGLGIMNSVVPITYNLSYLKNTNLSKKERSVITKICKKALENENVDIIGGITGFDKIRYMFKKLFNINSIKALNDGKYE